MPPVLHFITNYIYFLVICDELAHSKSLQNSSAEAGARRRGRQCNLIAELAILVVIPLKAEFFSS